MSNPTADALGADPYAEPCYCERCQGKRPLPCPYRPEVRTSKELLQEARANIHAWQHGVWKDKYAAKQLGNMLGQLIRFIERGDVPPYYCQNCDCAKCGNTRVRPDVPPERASHQTVSFPALPISAEDERIADAVTRRLRDETPAALPTKEFESEDMENVGRSLMETLHQSMPGYSWSESPAEVVVYLVNQRDDLKTLAAALLDFGHPEAIEEGSAAHIAAWNALRDAVSE